MFMVFVKTFEINENEVINNYQSELNNSLDLLSKKLSNEYTKITGESSDEYDKQKLGCYVDVSILDESYFKKIKEKHSRIFELIVKSNYKYFIQQYNSVKFGHSGHKKFIEDDRHISIMEWLMDWPEIATCTPLFDSAYIYEVIYGPNEGYKVDYDYYNLRDLRAKPEINKLFGIDGMPHENKFNYKELYGNIPESYCIMVKNGDHGDNINNEVLNSKNMSNRRTFNLVGGPSIEGPWFTDESWMIMVNCDVNADFGSRIKGWKGELFIIDRLIKLNNCSLEDRR